MLVFSKSLKAKPTIGVIDGPLNDMVHHRNSLLTGSLSVTDVSVRTHLATLSKAAIIKPSGLWGDGESRPASGRQTGLPSPQTQRPLWGCPCRFSDCFCSHLV